MMIQTRMIIGLILLPILLSACIGGSAPRVPNCKDRNIPLDWDHSPDALIIRRSDHGGLMAPVSEYNNFPIAQVWGDGRIIWQTRDEDGKRLVWQGQLSEAETTSLLQTFMDKRFFCMETNYRPDEEIFDATSTTLQLNLLAKSHHVNEYHSGAPHEFNELVSLVSSGAGAEGLPYVPQLGFLTAVPLDRNTGNLPTWDEAVAGQSLTEAVEGVWLEGEALAHAWALVNLKYWRPDVVQGDQVYQLYLQIPELTGKEPEQS